MRLVASNVTTKWIIFLLLDMVHDGGPLLFLAVWSKQQLAARLHGTYQKQVLWLIYDKRDYRCQVKNLAGYFFNIGDPDTVALHSRKNGAKGNPAVQEALTHQDKSHSDMEVGDDSVSQGKEMVLEVQVM